MNVVLQKFSLSIALAFALLLVVSAGCAPMAAEKNEGITVKLTGDQEVPSVKPQHPAVAPW